MGRFHPCKQLKQPWTLKPIIAEVPNSKRTLLQRPLLGGDGKSESRRKRAKLGSPLSNLILLPLGSLSPLAGSWPQREDFFSLSLPLPSWFIYSISRHAGQNGPFLASKTTSYPFAARQILTENHERTLWKNWGVFLAGHSQEAVCFAVAHVVGTSLGWKDSPHLHWRKRTNVWFGEPQGIFCDPLLFIEC